MSDLVDVANENGVVLVYPQGALLPGGSTHWNAAPTNGSSPSFINKSNIDDIGFFNAMLEEINLNNILDLNKVQVNLTEGFGLGFLLPRTNSMLLSKERYDAYHLSGYGISSMVGLNFSFFEKFFIQTEFKGGYINMPDIRTTNSKADSASQGFFFREITLLFGGIINLD